MTLFLQQFRRRRLTQWVLAYLAGAWLFLESFGFIAEQFTWPDYLIRGVMTLLFCGLLAVTILAWFHGERGRQRVTFVEGFMLGTVAVAACLILRMITPAEIADRCMPWDLSFDGDQSIAVLPFDHRGDDDDVYLTDGIHSEIVTRLGRITELRVASRTSALSYRDNERDLRSIGEALNVHYVLEGGVQRLGDRIHISSRLVDARTDRLLWSETYDRALTAENVFDIQKEVATAIALALDVNLSPRERRGVEAGRTESLEAYRLFLKGKHRQDLFTEDSLQQSIELFRQAIEHDPGFAPAHAALGEAYVWLGHGFGNVRPLEVYPLARAAATRALELDEHSADAHMTMGHLLWEVDWRNDLAERHLRQAIEMNPSAAEAHNVMGWFLLASGRDPEAKEAFAEAYSLDPLSSRMCRDLASPFRLAGEFARAIAQYRRCLHRHPDDWLTHLRLGRTLWFQSHEDAIASLETAEALNPRSVRVKATLGHAYAMSGRQDDARRVLAGLYAQAESGYVWPLAPAMIHAGLGERAPALDWLERASRERITQLVWLRRNYPELASLADDTRYRAIVELRDPASATRPAEP